MVKEDPESEAGKKKVEKLVERDVTKIRNEVDRKLDQCKADCPGECNSCGSEKIEELKLKLQVMGSYTNNFTPKLQLYHLEQKY